MPALRNFIAGDMIFGVGMAILLVGFVIWGVNRVMTLQSLEEIEPTAPSISDVLLASPDPSQFTATPTLLPLGSFSEEATPTIVIPTVNISVGVQVNLVAVERTYLRVIADGRVVFEGGVIPGRVPVRGGGTDRGPGGKRRRHPYRLRWARPRSDGYVRADRK
ncbi:MAG: hypothetical protein M0C28_36725 [Candidatus Moduliflexus flocculans]|nr:hypothetical protein [Candidatus Moduliflexus flocculans]